MKNKIGRLTLRECCEMSLSLTDLWLKLKGPPMVQRAEMYSAELVKCSYCRLKVLRDNEMMRISREIKEWPRDTASAFSQFSRFEYVVDWVRLSASGEVNAEQDAEPDAASCRNSESSPDTRGCRCRGSAASDSGLPTLMSIVSESLLCSPCFIPKLPDVLLLLHRNWCVPFDLFISLPPYYHWHVHISLLLQCEVQRSETSDDLGQIERISLPS
jgi:hypothetical protein